MAALGMLRSVSACPLYSLEVRFTLITIGTVCGKEDSIDIKDSGVLVWEGGEEEMKEMEEKGRGERSNLTETKDCLISRCTNE